MNGMDLVVKLTALRRFAERTREKLDELQYYTSLGILGESIARGMEEEIQKRIAYTDMEMNKVIKVIETTEVEY